MSSEENKLPLKTLRKASTLFAKETGFSGPQITDFFAEYGDHIIDYWELEARSSRWAIFEECLLSFPYNIQLKILNDLCNLDSDFCKYGLPEKEELDKLKKQIEQLSISVIDSVSAVNIDFDYIKEQIEKSNEKIKNNDFDGAVTNARSLLETILLHILNQSGVQDKGGDLIDMYKQTSKLLKLSPSQYQINSLKQILTGCFSIVHGLAEYRNEVSDAHGKSASRYSPIEKHHAIFYVNVSRSLADFLVDVWFKQNRAV